MTRCGVYTPETHQVTPMALRAEQVCAYDLDDVDQRWLTALNGERALTGAGSLVSELEMERAMEMLERQAATKMSSFLKTSDDSDEADDSVICDVCRSVWFGALATYEPMFNWSVSFQPDSEECNEMVFCDRCNICVHQACYGIKSIPAGSWVCRTCTLRDAPNCELCPNRGGAMKSTKSGNKWAHVSCALWIPEVSIGDVEKMEPITKISSIPVRILEQRSKMDE